ncbi:MAG: hypothetical protein KA715_07455 [Xanthomonadaceae bacterium]|nr:hypothetical protein [Xanthomonadaceae bacterium]
MKFSQRAYLAELFTFFPDSEYYFLARDAEYLHDLAVVLLQDQPKLLRRLHLVPISTALSGYRDNMVKYLKQEGMTLKQLEGRPVLFIDSCCRGSVPDEIIAAFKNSKIKIQAHLVRTDNYPESSLSLALGSNGMDMENLPHYNHSGSEYVENNDLIRIKAKKSLLDQRQKAMSVMFEIRSEFNNDSAREQFKELVKLMKKTYRYFGEAKPTAEEEAKVLQDLRRLRSEFNIPSYPLIKDFALMKRKNYSSLSKNFINEFIKRNNELFALDNEMIAKNIIKNPNALLEAIKSTREENKPRLVTSVIDLLSESTPESLGIDAKDFSALIVNWNDVLKRFSKNKTLESIEVFYKTLRLNHESKKYLLESLISLLKGIVFDSGDIENLIFKMIFEELGSEAFVYSEKSMMKAVIGGNMYFDYPTVFSDVIRSFVKNATALDTEKMLVEMFAVLPFNAFINSSDIEFYLQSLQDAIRSLPMINADFMRALFRSHLTNDKLLTSNKQVRSFWKWILTRNKNFHPHVAKMGVPEAIEVRVINSTKWKGKVLTVQKAIDVLKVRGVYDSYFCSDLMTND